MTVKINYLTVKRHWFEGTPEKKEAVQEKDWLLFQWQGEKFFFNKSTGLLFPDLSIPENIGTEVDLYREPNPKFIAGCHASIGPFSGGRTITAQEFKNAFTDRIEEIYALGWRELAEKRFAVRPMKQNSPVYSLDGRKAGYWGRNGDTACVLFAVPVNEKIQDQSENGVISYLYYHGLEKIPVEMEEKMGDGKASIMKPDDKQMELIRNKLRKSDLKRTGSICYGYDIFNPSKGDWDLWKYVKYNEYPHNQLIQIDPGEGRMWADVSERQLYAADPEEDLGNLTDVIAVDFGTRSTAVAQIDSGGFIATMPVGDAESPDEGYENPTIMEYIDFQKFYDAYKSAPGRPDTDSRHLSTSYQAQDSFKKRSLEKNLNAYHYQLKQWAQGSMREPVLIDQENIRVPLKPYLELEEDDYDPIEIYAYYVGLNIVNMQRRKICMRYLLSYPPAYDGKVLKRIRDSFRRGLLKAMPEEIQKSVYFQKNFSVELWQSEPAAYAVAALRRNNVVPEKNPVLCAVYDFGGGTVDYSFGVFSGEMPPYEYRCLYSGGNALAGCEVLLEELAYELFYRNRETLADKEVKYLYPLHYPSVGMNSAFTGDSQQARLNTLAAVDRLREGWIKGLPYKRGNEPLMSFYVYPEGKRESSEVRVMAPGAERRGGDKVIYLEIEPEFFEEFFWKKIQKSVDNFYQGLEKVLRMASENGRDMPDLKGMDFKLFLGGNACRAPLVEMIFQEMIESKPVFREMKAEIYPPMTADAHTQKWEGELPTAKTGVVHGLLLSRLGSTYVNVTGGEFQEFLFRYTVGHAEYDQEKGLEIFCVDYESGRFRKSEDRFRINPEDCCFITVRQEGFLQFWYTDDRAAETAGRLPLADSHAKQFMIIDPRIHSGDRIALTVDLDADSQLIVICVDPEGNAEKLGNADLSNGRFMQE